MVRIGIVGLGFMGWIHWLGARKLKGAKVSAVCSRDPKKLSGDWRSIRGNFGPAGEQVDLSKIKKFPTLDEMLADPDIDLIDICNPTHLHAEYAIAALKAGKHVLVEKAIGLDVKEADAMLKASKQSGKLLMVAHVLPFFPEFAYAAEVVRDETFGKLQAAHFRRHISKPDWSKEIGDAGKTGGPAVDLHVHDTHFIGLLAGVPDRVFSAGVVEREVVTYLTTSYLYGEGGPAVTCSSGALAQKAREFTHGYEIYLEKATLYYEAGLPVSIHGADGKTKQAKIKGGGDAISAFTNELQAAVDSIEADQVHPMLSAQLARDALAMCYKEIQSVKTGKIVKV